MKGAKASNERNEANLKQAADAGEAPFWEIIVFSHTWRSNIKAETRGTYTGKLSQQFYNSISYFSTFYVYFFFGFPILRSDTVSGNREEFEKSKFTKTGVNITIVYTFTENPLSASAVKSQETKYICKQHINTTSNISREPHLQRVKTLKKQIYVLLKCWKQSVTLWGYCDNINR